MSEHPHVEGNLLIQMVDTWLRYQDPDELDSEDVAKAADLLRRAGVTRSEVKVFFGPPHCLPPRNFSDDETEAQHRVALARFAELRRAFQVDP
jgi:hypothetical protein